MSNPTVSFVVPCYKLAHLLPDCIESILRQTFGDFEILVMDDCSPDNTEGVASSFRDPRVIYVRNEQNLGCNGNFNRGISLSRGKYIWLISADDYLRQPYVLLRYVDVLERHPRVGYAFCSGVGVEDGKETGLLDYSNCGTRDRIIPGHKWLKKLLTRNLVLAASGLVRRECYEKFSMFPLDMPWSGDWYLWCLFALHRDVAYFFEPMVCYRAHSLNLSGELMRTQAMACCEQEIALRWDIKRKADAAGLSGVSRDCLRAVAEAYAKSAASSRFGMSHPIMTVDQVEQSLCQNTQSEQERAWVRAKVFARIGDEHYWRGDASAAQFYEAALKIRPLDVPVIAKRALLGLGSGGSFVRSITRSLAAARER